MLLHGIGIPILQEVGFQLSVEVFFCWLFELFFCQLFGLCRFCDFLVAQIKSFTFTLEDLLALFWLFIRSLLQNLPILLEFMLLILHGPILLVSISVLFILEFTIDLFIFKIIIPVFLLEFILFIELFLYLA